MEALMKNENVKTRKEMLQKLVLESYLENRKKLQKPKQSQAIDSK